MNDITQIIISVIGTVTKIVLAAIIIMWVVKNASVAYDWGFRIFGETAVDEEPGFEVTIDVDDNTDLKSLGDELEELGLIRSSMLFQIQGKLAKLDDGIDRGRYSLTSAMTVEEMVGILAQGKNGDFEEEPTESLESSEEVDEPSDPMDEEGTESVEEEDALEESNEEE